MAFAFRSYFSKKVSNVGITVVRIDQKASQPCKFVHFNLSDNLSKVRLQLEKRDMIDSTLSFARKFIENGNSKFAEIEFEDEEDILLDKIVRQSEESEDTFILNLMTCSKFNWKILNKLHKLDYGRTMTSDGIKRADKRAFEMKNCILEIGNKECETGIFTSESSEDLMMDKNLFFNTDINIRYFVKLGIGVSIGTSKSKESCVETNYYYRFIKYGKASLKLKYEHLEATPEFIKVIESAISSEDPAEQFKQILKDFGQFIPTNVILGGRVHYDNFTKSVKHTVGKSNEFSKNINIGDLKGELGKGSTNSEENSNNYSRRYSKVIGGEQPDNIENLDIGNWLLPEDLRKRIIKSVGMKIHHLHTENHNCVLEEFRKPIQFNLSIPNEISKIIKNKDVDFKIFATVTDITKSKNDFFTCQVLCPSNGKLPSLIIHRVQNSFKIFKRRECKLKIGWMVIGYYRDFNFDYNTRLDILHYDYDSNAQDTDNLIEYDSKVPICLGIPVVREYPNNESLVIGYYYRQHENNKIKACTFAYCLKDKCLVKLPNFTFYTLKITNYHNHGACSTITLRKKEYSNFNTESPKFVSIYSAEKTDCVFLKQRNGQVKIKKIGNDNTVILSVKCAIFDPYLVHQVETL
ncbi:unnamed protein product [Rhizophagus irregularis]|nr:unnamed protein product [Rhizophagus irregularis]